MICCDVDSFTATQPDPARRLNRVQNGRRFLTPQRNLMREYERVRLHTNTSLREITHLLRTSEEFSQSNVTAMQCLQALKEESVTGRRFTFPRTCRLTNRTIAVDGDSIRNSCNVSFLFCFIHFCLKDHSILAKGSPPQQIFLPCF